MYGTASLSKHNFLSGMGVVPIDYHHQDYVEVIRKVEPAGLDFVFDGIGGKFGDRGLEVLRRGGKFVGYAAPVGLLSMLQGLLRLGYINLMPNGKSADYYGITAQYVVNKKPFMEDLPQVFKLLEEGRIKPIIAQKFSLLEAAKANQLLESGIVVGNLVLLSPELL